MNQKEYIKYLVIYKQNNDIEIGLREDSNNYYIDVNKNDLYINLHKQNKSNYMELIAGINKKNQKQTYLTIINSIITDYLLKVKSNDNNTIQ